MNFVTDTLSLVGRFYARDIFSAKAHRTSNFLDIGQLSRFIHMAGKNHMDKQEIIATEKRVKTSTRQVGNTTFTVIAHYAGEQTYLDMVKDVLRREIGNS